MEQTDNPRKLTKFKRNKLAFEEEACFLLRTAWLAVAVQTWIIAGYNDNRILYTYGGLVKCCFFVLIKPYKTIPNIFIIIKEFSSSQTSVSTKKRSLFYLLHVRIVYIF